MNTTTRQTQPIDLESVFEAFRQPTSLVQDRAVRETIEAYIATARVHQERAIIELLSDIAATINAHSTDTVVRLEYEAKQLVLAIDSGSNAETDELARMDGDLEKVTVRLPSQLKKSIDRAADARGVSLNTWCVFTLARAISRHMRHDPGMHGEGSSDRRHGRRGRRHEMNMGDMSFGDDRAQSDRRSEGPASKDESKG